MKLGDSVRNEHCDFRAIALRVLKDFLMILSWGFASLYPRLYASTRYAG